MIKPLLPTMIDAGNHLVGSRSITEASWYKDQSIEGQMHATWFTFPGGGRKFLRTKLGTS